MPPMPLQASRLNAMGNMKRLDQHPVCGTKLVRLRSAGSRCEPA